MCSRSLEAPLWIALPVYSAPFIRPQLTQDAPSRQKLFFLEGTILQTMIPTAFPPLPLQH